MAGRYKKKNESYAKVYDLISNNGHLIKTENMYVDHDIDELCLESFPGYRRLAKMNGKINGIFLTDFGEEIYLVHSGNSLYKCRYFDDHRDEFNYSEICSMNDQRSFSYHIGDYICIFDGADITVVDRTLTAKKLSQNKNLAYTPTTFINGEEAEQINILSNMFYEKISGISVYDMAYESEGLIYQIVNEKSGTCGVCGIHSSIFGRVEIPTRKLINGKYYKVVEICNNAFSGNDRITEVVISGSVKRVGENAFAYCSSLQTAAMLDGIETIDRKAFYGSGALTEVYIGVTCKKIHFDAFYDCDMLTDVYFSGDDAFVVECDGFADMLRFNVEYWCPYIDLAIGVPIHTPASRITDLWIDDEMGDYTEEPKRGIIKIPYVDSGELEGRTVLFKGIVDEDSCLNSNRRTPFSVIFNDIDSYSALISTHRCATFDDRVFLYQTEDAPSVVFASSYTLDGKAHPLYFGELDYMQVGNPAFAVSSVVGLGKHLAISKNNEGHGSIFVHTVKGNQGSAYGRSYQQIYAFRDTDIRSGLGVFDEAFVFMDGEGVSQLKCNSSGADIRSISLGTIAMRGYGCEDAIFSSIKGDLAVFAKGALFLGDPKLSYNILGKSQYRWFPIYEVGGFIGDTKSYYYSEVGHSGILIHPKAGEVADGEIYSYKDDDGNMIYYVKSGIRKYAVVPSDEATGGEVIAVSAIEKGENTLIFGNEGGDVFALNTDKRGYAPKSIYQRIDYDQNEYDATFRDVIHPLFYNHADHKVKYCVTTPPDDCSLPYQRKSTIRNSLTIRLPKRINKSVFVGASIDGGEEKRICQIPMGEIDFESFDFGNLTMLCESSENLSVPENEKNWVEKQIIIYTDEVNSPLAIYCISYGYVTSGRIKNK